MADEKKSAGKSGKEIKDDALKDAAGGKGYGYKRVIARGGKKK